MQRAQNFNARQSHRFRLDLEGFNSIAVQSVDIPKLEIDEVKYATAGTDVKRPGRLHTGDLVVRGCLIDGGEDMPVLAWFFSTFNPMTGLGSAPADLRDGSIVHLDAAGREYERWNFTEAWVKAVDGYKFDRNKSEVFMQEVTISVYACMPAALAG